MEQSLESLTKNPWLLPMVKTELFHKKCEEHITRKKCLFCIECMTPPFCDQCNKKPNHHGHTLIQTYRSSYQTGVQIQTISKYLDTSEISIYVINSHKIIYIQRRQKEDTSRAHILRKCEVCGWELDSASMARFCSIECKLRCLLGSKLDELMDKPETITQTEPETNGTEVEAKAEVVVKSFRKRKRKGIPERGPWI